MIPQFSGAAYVYEHYVRPFYTGNQTVNVWYVPRKKDAFTPHQDETLVSANKYIHEYTTPDAFQFQEYIQPAVRIYLSILMTYKYTYIVIVLPLNISYILTCIALRVLQFDDHEEIKYYGGGGFFPEYDYVYD